FTESEHFTLLDDGSMKIYRNNDAYPRAWVARPESVLADTQEIERRFVEGEIDPKDELILNPLPANVRTFPNGRSGTAMANIRPIGGDANSRARGGAIPDEQVLIDVSSPDPAYLILADTFYPGWKAEIDGVPVNKIYKAFGYFRAIEIPAGNHLVRFFFKPDSFTIGVTLSVVTLSVSVILLIVQLLFFRKPKSSED
ncbi:MAG: hypothetical protein NTY09_02525, partial [bacterium]|nr:hypothetical protein [bacterium]